MEEVRIDAKMKRQILKDWQSVMPGYVKEDTYTISRRIGPVLQSINLDYHGSPHVSYTSKCYIYNMASFDIWGAMMLRITGGWCDSWEDHNNNYMKYVEACKNKSYVPVEGEVSLSMVLRAYEEYKVKGRPLPSNSMGEDPALICTWAGKLDLAEKLLEEGKNYISVGIENYPEECRKKNEWYEKTKELIKQPELLRQRVEDLVKEHKLEKIPYSELIIDI